MVRGEIFRLPPPRQRADMSNKARYAVVVQAEESLGLSTLLVSPTSTNARAQASGRLFVSRDETRVLAEQTTVVDPEGSGDLQDGSTRRSCEPWTRR